MSFSSLFIILAILFILYIIWEKYILKNELEKIKSSKKNNTEIKKDISKIQKEKIEKAEARDKLNSLTGITQLNEDNVGFLDDLKQLQDKLDRNEQIGVNAAQAFFLIRNSPYHNLVTSEDGIIFLQNKIMNYKTSDEEKNINNDGTKFVTEEFFKEDGYVRRTLENGTVVCTNFNGQIIPDPTEIKIEQNNNAKYSSEQVGDLSKKVSKLIELAKTENVKEVLSGSDYFSSPQEDDTSIKSTVYSQNPLENEAFNLRQSNSFIEAPQFDMSELDELFDEGGVNTNNITLTQKFNFLSIDDLSRVMCSKNFFTLFFENLFTTSDKYFFINDNNQILVEKNLLYCAIEKMISEDTLQDFKNVFLLEGSIDLISFKPLSAILENISPCHNDIFISEQKRFIERYVVERKRKAYDCKCATIDISLLRNYSRDLISILNKHIIGHPEISTVLQKGAEVERFLKRASFGSGKLEQIL
ncbi:MAG: hypothetical protein PHE67_00090 [Campylobacterales bacterium]|nr:hypothetical protein [Campylobacterales bacterium]